MAAEIALPYPEFVARTTAYAAQVNANFAEVETKFNNQVERFNAKSYGTVGDGVTDDSAALQAAITAAAAAATPLFIPAGTYLLKSQLTLPSRTHIIGAGTDNTILKLDATLTLTAIINSDTANGNDDITVESLQIDGNKAARGAVTNPLLNVTTYGAVGKKCRRIVYRDLYAHDSPSLGIVFQSVQGGQIVGCHVANNSRDGITCYFDSQDILIADNWIHNCGDDFIGLNAEDASSTAHTMTRIVVANNRVGGGGVSQGSGVSCRGGSHVLIVGNVISESFSSGVVVSNANTTPGTDVTVANNVIVDGGKNNSGAAGHGIEIQGGTPIISAGGYAGVARLTIVGNIIKNPRAMGVTLSSGNVLGTLTDIVIRGNSLYGASAIFASARGIHSPDGRVTRIRIEGNTITNWPSRGIHLEEATGTNKHTHVEILDNVVMDNGAEGIYLGYCDNIRVHANRSTDTRVGGARTQTIGLSINTITVADLNDNYLGNNKTSAFATAGVNTFDDVPSRGGAFQFNPATGAGYALRSVVGVEANDRVRIGYDGLIEIGAGGATAVDTNLYRSAADTLKTDDSFHIGAALRHLGSTLGFFNVAAVSKPSAYTQTYATADKTHANPTAAALTHAVGTADGTVDDVGAAFNQTTLNNNFKELTTQIAAIVADIADVKQLANSVIDDLQALGLVG